MPKRKVTKLIDGKEVVERPLRSYTMLISKNGNATSAWFEIGEGGINSNQVPFHPPFIMRLVSIQFSNLDSHSSSEFALRIHSDIADGAGSIGTGDPITAEIASLDSDIDFLRTDRRAWSSESLFDRNIILEPRGRYAFRLQRLSGGQSSEDTVVILNFEEEQT